MKNVDVQPSFLIRDICAGGKGHMPPPPFGNILKSWIILYRSMHSNDIPGQFFWSTLKNSPPFSGPLLLIC